MSGQERDLDKLEAPAEKGTGAGPALCAEAYSGAPVSRADAPEKIPTGFPTLELHDSQKHSEPSRDSGNHPSKVEPAMPGITRPDSGRPSDSVKPSDAVKPSESTGDSRKDPPKDVDVTVARGVNDLSSTMGKGATLDRHDTGDTLTLPDGIKVRVSKSDDGYTVTETDASGKTERRPFLDGKDPYVKLKDGSTIKFGPSGQLDAVSYEGKIYRFQKPKF